jgi:NTP pyrophosphatase (non-canonical NTP hydrolase)
MGRRFDEYQDFTRTTANYPNHGPAGLYYPAALACEEAGELVGKVNKWTRDGVAPGTEYTNDIMKEIGDVLWALAQVCIKLGVRFSDVVKMNVEKLESRQRRGVISGSGDNR